MKRSYGLRTLLKVAAAVCAVAAAWPPAQAQQPSQARSYEMNAEYRLGGQSTGTYHEASSVAADGASKTSIESDMVFNRLGTKLEMKSKSDFQEGGDGQLLGLVNDQSSSEQGTHLDVQVKAGTVAIKTTTGDKTYDKSATFTGSLIGPEGARRLLVARLHAPGDEVSYQTFSPELGVVVTITNKLVANENVNVGKQTVPTLKLEQSMSLMPEKVTEWVDAQGWMVRMVMPTPLGDIEAVRTDTASAAKLEGASLPEESFTRSIVKSNIRLPEERLIEAVRLKIVHRKPELGWPQLENDNQHVVEKTANYAILDVTRPQPRTPAARPVDQDSGNHAYLSPNALLQSDDANVQAIAKSIVGDERDSWRAAQALQRWTNDNMHFDLGIAVASASEVAKNRRGTCFGYAILLGSLTRAAGIPSRMRLGYVYAGGIWGGHAWVDVKIGDNWIPLDGALYSPGAADAARFSFYTSALDEGSLTGLGEMGRLFGNVDVQILSYTVAGQTVNVPEGAEGFTIQGDQYRNPWIGFSIRKPAGFQFKDVDVTWPESTLVAMEGPDGRTLKVENVSVSLPTGAIDAAKTLADRDIHGPQKTLMIGGEPTTLEAVGDKAGAVMTDHGNVWVITATGSKAGELLNETIRTVGFKH